MENKRLFFSLFVFFPVLFFLFPISTVLSISAIYLFTRHFTEMKYFRWLLKLFDNEQEFIA